jgi:hypothetical protein
MGVLFIVVGDFDGQQKPIFDRWNDAMEQHDIRDSNLLHEMCGGLHVRLTVYRRGLDQQLFDSYTALYRHADNCNRAELECMFEGVAQRYPWEGEEIDKFFCKSHRLRILINAAVNKRLAEKRPLGERVFIEAPKEKMRGVTMQPQDMWVWKGMELLCNTREYERGRPVNGGVYVVEAFNSRTVRVRLHEDYRPKFEHHSAENPEDVENLTADDEDSEHESEEEEAEEEAQPPPKKKARVQDPEKVGVHVLEYEEVMETLRLQHALVHASVQGRTMRNEHIGILDCFTPNFTMRNMIVAMSRATHGKFVHVFNSKQQRDLLKQLQTEN